MLSVKHNLSAINANNSLQINSRNNKRAIEKLSSGYRINRAADDAAGLAISEKMRRLIRGLRQGTTNAQDGVSFVQVADGAMDGVSGMLHRMYELALKSMNGTCSDSDRGAMNAEFDQLRSEVDRINKTTQFNDQPVFEEHESSYYQIIGCKTWDDNQLHTVPALNNELSIHLPDYYEPCDYTLTVPPGVYSTQELIDEIDSALEVMSPSNPGFVFEYTDKGICKLNFERADGLPTEIGSIDGSLSYLFFDSFSGSSSSSLMGTTVFDSKYPLTITKDQNDQLGFYVENASGSNFISMTLPPGKYTRPQMIELINKELAGTSVIAKEYQDSCIQITGGPTTTITGLTGNMFKLESSSPIYSSVFYDNVKYGSSSGGSSAIISGSAYYGNSFTEKIYLSAANKNNTLRFKVNGAADYTEIIFPDKADGYTMADIATEINKQLAAEGLLSTVSASVGSSSVNLFDEPTDTSYYYLDYLRISSLIQGSSSSLEFDTTDPVAAKTFNALFCETNYLPYQLPGNHAKLSGQASLNKPFTLPSNASLEFTIDQKSYTINGIGGNYTNSAELVDKINDIISNDAAFSSIQGKIKFTVSSGKINIEGLTNEIRKIYFDNGQKNDTYKQLFVSTSTSVNSPYPSDTYGTVSQPQGSTAVTVTPASTSVYVSSSIQNSTITITNDTNKIVFGSSDGTKTVTLPVGKCSMADIVAQINAQLRPSNGSHFSSIQASLVNDRIVVTATPSTDNANGSYYISFDTSSSAWKAIYGTSDHEYHPSSTEASDDYLGTRRPISDATTIDNSNNELTLTVGQDTVTLSIPSGTYDKTSLKNAVQAAIDNSNLKDKITVNAETNGTFTFCSSGGSITASGSFYEEVLTVPKTEKESIQQGGYQNYDYGEAYIIGRKDITTGPIDIISGANDTFIFNFAYKDTTTQGANSYSKEMQVKIPEGTYTGDEVAKILQEQMQKKFDEEGIDDFEIQVGIGIYNTNVVGANDDTALQIVVKRKNGKEPAQGEYVLDGIRGSAAGFLFYKTTINPRATFITGTKDLSQGVSFKTGQNVFTFSADGIPYKYTFPENKHFTGQEFVDMLNDMFTNGDDNGNSAPLKASLENGVLKISHKALGSHSITDIGGSARSTLFLEENGGTSREPLRLLVGAESEDIIDIPRTRIGSCSLAINTITISKPKYAQKAVNRLIDAIVTAASRRSTYGAMQNRLEHTINNNNNVIENTQASESIIRDTDMASEAVRQAENSILVQASQAILSQTNQRIQEVMNLLQA